MWGLHKLLKLQLFMDYWNAGRLAIHHACILLQMLPVFHTLFISSFLLWYLPVAAEQKDRVEEWFQGDRLVPLLDRILGWIGFCVTEQGLNGLQHSIYSCVLCFVQLCIGRHIFAPYLQHFVYLACTVYIPIYVTILFMICVLLRNRCPNLCTNPPRSGYQCGFTLLLLWTLRRTTLRRPGTNRGD